MNFLLSEDQIQLQDALSKMLEQNCTSLYLHKFIDEKQSHDPGMWQAICEFGATAVNVPEEYGGLALEMIDLALIAETLGEYAVPSPFLTHAMATQAFIAGGSDTQKEQWLPLLASGGKIATVALVEDDGAWMPEQWTLEAGGRLNGVKQYVPHGQVADVMIVGLKGGRLGIVDLSENDSVSFQPMGGVDLTRRIDIATFSNTPVDLLPESEEATNKFIDAGLVLIAADSFGGATHSVDMAVNYAQEREQFGLKIAQFQALRHQLADMALQAEPCRGLYWYAAHAYDYLPEEARHAAAQAKAHISDRYLQVSRDCIEAHGGVGYTWEYDPHIWKKRAMFNWAWLGSPRVHRERAAQLSGW